MHTLEILFYIGIGFYIGLCTGIFIAYKLRQWAESDDRILDKDVDEWMEDQELTE